MAITFLNAPAVPTDNGTNTTNPTAFSNPPSTGMATGDLVVVFAWCRTGSATIAVSNAGGQTWNSFTSQSSANATLSLNVFWCRFNGTWSAAPSFSFGATTNNNVWMVIFHPTSGSNLWGIDPNKSGVFTDTAAAASFTIADWSTSLPSTVSIVGFFTDDDNLWGSPGGSWTTSGMNLQIRNTSGNDASGAVCYQILTALGAVGACTRSESTLGNDGGFTFGITFYEYAPKAPNKSVKINQSISRASYI